MFAQHHIIVLRCSVLALCKNDMLAVVRMIGVSAIYCQCKVGNFFGTLDNILSNALRTAVVGVTSSSRKRDQGIKSALNHALGVGCAKVRSSSGHK